VAGKQC
jgi:DNA-binding HxlR family transcriptional regulator